MKIFGILAGLMVAIFGFFLAEFANPIGWLILLIGALAVCIVVIRNNIASRAEVIHNVRSHGPEDRERGSNKDPML